jgi:2-oxoglutarate ferredoxin oxidoreductase subunit gamma
VLNPDILVTMSQTALDKYVRDLKPGGTLIVDQDLVQTLPDRDDFRGYRAPFAEIASTQLGKSLVANMVMLGFLTGVTGVVSLDALRESVKTGVPKGTEELNLKALETGITLGGQEGLYA